VEIIQKIKASIAPIVSLTDTELSAFSGVFETRRFKKNEFFLKEGQVCNFLGFINYGVLVYCKIVDNGDEITTDFAFEGDWVTVNQSRLNNSPSLINIKAIEDSELFVIRQQDLSDLYIKIPKIERLGRILMEQAYLKIVQQSVDLQVLTATERYENLLHQFP
jgi:CRP-like cAMP-binding protein